MSSGLWPSNAKRQQIPFGDDKQKRQRLERRRLLGSALRQQHFDQQQTRAADNRGVGYVEIGPVVAVDVNFKKVDHVAEPQTIVKIAESSAEDESKGNRRNRDGAANAPENSDHD